jgi:phytoene desaturase
MLTVERPPRIDTPSEDQRPHAVVIGSGFGGLAGAVRLGAKGYRVTVLERLEAPGGRASVHRQDGFTFDAGPTIITAPFLFEDLWRLCGRRMSDDVDLRPVDPFYRLVFDDGETIDCWADRAAMRAEVARISPSDLDGYDRFMVRSEAICKLGFEELGHVPFLSLSDMARQAPDLFKLGGLSSVHGLVSRYVKHPRLRFALSFHPLFVGGNPFDTTAVYCMIAYFERRWGVHFAMGGTGALVKGLVGLIRGQGGAIRYGAEVDQILLEGGAARGVRLSSGERIMADIVVSNADAAYTYKKLIPAEARKRWTDRKLDRAKYSMSLFVWYFGTRRQYRELEHHTILLGPRYKGLIRDIFDGRPLAEDMSLYLHRPTATDPSLAPPGCDAFYVLSPVPHLDADIDWATQAEPYRRAVEKRLSETLLPGLADQIVTSRVTTPQDFHDRYLSIKGAAFSLAPTLLQSAWFRPNNRSEDVQGLYLVGAGAQPGAGVPGVLSSARMLDALVPDAVARG